MAKRETLIDLQHRLADRLAAVRTEPPSSSWLAVMVGKAPCLFPLVQSGEIFSLGAVARVPYARPWFAGVVNLRGGLYGVVDLARFMGGEAAPSRSEQAWSEVRLVTFNAELEINCALMVDALMGLRRPEAFASAEPAPHGAAAYLGNRFTDKQGQIWQEINLHGLSQTSEFLAIGT
jgi:twitching motility protein PilI